LKQFLNKQNIDIGCIKGEASAMNVPINWQPLRLQMLKMLTPSNIIFKLTQHIQKQGTEQHQKYGV